MGQRNKSVALVVAAGSGNRAGGDLPKQYALLAGKSVLAHAIDRLDHHAIDEVRVVIGAGQEALYAAAIEGRSLPSPIIGGQTRRQSVLNGLEALAASAPDVVLIHDAARPFVSRLVIDRLLAALEAAEGAVPILPVADSMARAEDGLGEAVDRHNMVRVQTPQAFHFKSVLGAHRTWNAEEEATDDAQIVRAAGFKVATVAGDPALDKFTYPEDFKRAERRLSAALVSRTGLGFDVHALADGEALWLGGLHIPFDRGLKGHSDADVVLHALTDALLGAIGEGDIGDHFPPSDAKWRGAPSSGFVNHARMLIDRRGGRVDHVDITIICEAPRIGPHRQAMREAIAAMLRIPAARISVKATTTERLGFAGRGEGIAAQAVATVRLPEDL